MKNKYQEYLDVFNRLIPSLEHSLETRLRDFHNNEPIDEMLSCIRETLSLAAQGKILHEGKAAVDLLTLQKAKCLIRFHVKEGACISIEDKTYNALDIYSELNRAWLDVKHGVGFNSNGGRG